MRPMPLVSRLHLWSARLRCPCCGREFLVDPPALVPCGDCERRKDESEADARADAAMCLLGAIAVLMVTVL